MTRLRGQRSTAVTASNRRAVLVAAGWLHNLPNTLIGLAVAAAGISGSSFLCAGHNAIQFFNNALVLPGYAITLGNVILYGPGADPRRLTRTGVTLGEHERQHTVQGQQLGVLYLPSQLMGGIAGLLFDRSWHGPSNWNERGPQGTPPRPW